MSTDFYVRLGALVIIAVLVALIVVYHVWTLPKAPARVEAEPEGGLGADGRVRQDV